MARFVQLKEQELENLCTKKNAKNTDRATITGLNTLISFIEESGSDTNIDKMSLEDLNSLLVRFYAGARTKKGDLYKLNSMRSLRFSLQRHFLEVFGIDIIENEIFRPSNTCFENVLKEIKKVWQRCHRSPS